jgi:hypothetical protein
LRVSIEYGESVSWGARWFAFGVFVQAGFSPALRHQQSMLA